MTNWQDWEALWRADRRVYREYARAQRHKGFEQIRVTFKEPSDS